jgi:hypothetical protein
MAAPLLDLLLAKGAELAGRAIAKGVDWAGRKLLGEPEVVGQPVPMKDILRRRAQEEAAISHKVPPK